MLGLTMPNAINARRSQFSTVCTSHQITYTVKANGNTVTKPLMVSVKSCAWDYHRMIGPDAPQA